MNFSQCNPEHKHDQCESDSITDEEYYAIHNRVNFSLTFYHSSVYPKFYKMYKSNKYREMIFTSNHHLCLYPNELKFEPLHVS